MSLSLFIPGQPRGCGKNSLGVTRIGIRYPKPEFVQWREAACLYVRQQRKGTMFTTPLKATIRYTPGDAKRRDVPAVMDGLWHVLERAGVIADDALIKHVDWTTTAINRDAPGVRITLEEAL